MQYDMMSTWYSSVTIITQRTTWIGQGHVKVREHVVSRQQPEWCKSCSLDWISRSTAPWAQGGCPSGLESLGRNAGQQCQASCLPQVGHIDAHEALPGMTLNSCSITQSYTGWGLSEDQPLSTGIFTGWGLFSWKLGAGVISDEEIVFVFPRCDSYSLAPTWYISSIKCWTPCDTWAQ